MRFSKKRWIFLLPAIGAIGFVGLVQPSNNRDWAMDQKVLPAISISSDVVTIRHLRCFRYRTPEDYEAGYRDQSLNLKDLKRVWFVVEPFSTSWKGLAHTLLSFEFAGGDFVTISVEIRKEKGETYSPLKGLFRRYELVYVIADEEDVIFLRTNARRHDVYLYPVNATPELARQLFVSMLQRAQTLETRPEFYNTLTNTCTTNIVKHIRQMVPGGIPRSYKVLLPGYSDRLAYDLKLIDHSVPFEDVRRRHWISGRARQYVGQGHFSQVIRQ